MFDVAFSDLLLVTTNAYVKTNGKLVMGRGAAYQMTQRYPWTPLEFGRMVEFHARTHQNEPYGLLISTMRMKPALGIFQVKRVYSDAADLGLIAYSVGLLTEYANTHPTTAIAMNYPGIGNGRLRVADVEPLLKPLPDNVEIWTL